MKALPIVIAALAAFAAVRTRRRRRGRGSSRPRGAVAARLRDANLLGDTGLVAGREIRERVRGRVFRVVTIILFLVVAAVVVIPTLGNGSSETQRVGVVGGSAAFDAGLHELATSVGLSAVVVPAPDWKAARAALVAGRLDVVVDAAGRILVPKPVPPTGTSPTARFALTLASNMGAHRAFARAGLTPAQAAIVARARPVGVESLHPGRKARSTAETTALVGVILIFVVLTQYLTWTLMGVMEEKASRVVEVLLATVRPLQLLAGKLLGIGVVAILQAVALVAFALLVAEAVGSSVVQGASPEVVAAILVWLILGYAFYSWLYAAAGSLAERQDQVQSLALPLSAPLILGYVVSLTGVSSGNASLLVKVLAYLPPTAPFAMPTLVGLGAVTWWQFLLSVLVSLGCTALVALAAARVYRTAVLRTGSRVRLRELLPTFGREASSSAASTSR